jgi:microcystin-dependent protein
MSTPFLAEIKIVSFGFAPSGWALCNGQLLPISQNQALFSLLGTTYGGDGRVNFGLPNLQGRAPIHEGQGFTLGQLGGEQAHTLTISEIAGHQHTPQGYDAGGNAAPGATTVWAQGVITGQPPHNLYSGAGNTAMNTSALANTGGSQAHDNMQPYLVLNFVIALSGIFPSQN